jgi:hypothetical protein
MELVHTCSEGSNLHFEVVGGNLAGDQGQTDGGVDLVYGMHCTWMPWHNLPHTDLQGYCSFHTPFLVVVVVVVGVGAHSQFQWHQLGNLPASLTHKDSDVVEVVLYHSEVCLLCQQ